MNRRIVLIIVNIVVIIILVSCYSSNKYKEFTMEFYEKYFDVIRDCESNNIEEFFINISRDVLQEQRKELYNIINEAKDIVPEKQLEHYKKIEEWHSQLREISQIGYTWDKMTVEQRRKIGTILINLQHRLNNWDDSNSNVVW